MFPQRAPGCFAPRPLMPAGSRTQPAAASWSWLVVPMVDLLRVLVEEGVVGGVELGRVLRDHRGRPQLLPPRLHRLERARQHDLEPTELGVAVVLGRVPEASRLVVGLLDLPAGGD